MCVVCYYLVDMLGLFISYYGFSLGWVMVSEEFLKFIFRFYVMYN